MKTEIGVRPVLSALLLALLAAPAFSAPPQYLNFQGKLADNTGNPLTGTYSLRFCLWDSPGGGTQIFCETWQGPSNTVSVANGAYSVLIGTLTAGGIPASDFDNPLYLEIAVQPGSSLGASPMVLSPRVPLAATAYSFQAARADNISGIVPPANGGTGEDLSSIPAGSLLYSSATGSITALSTTSSNGYILTTINGMPAWQPAGAVFLYSTNTWYANQIFKNAIFIDTDAVMTGDLSASSVSAGSFYGSGANLTNISTATFSPSFILPPSMGGTGADLSAGALGDLPYFSGAGVMARLPAGTAGYVLESQGSAAPQWIAPAQLMTSVYYTTGTWSAQQIFDNELFVSSAIAVAPGAYLAIGGIAPTNPLSVGGNANISGNLTTGGLSVNGYITSQSSITGSFFGNGSGLYSLNASSVSSGILPLQFGGTGADLSGQSPGALPYFASASSMAALSPVGTPSGAFLTWTGSSIAWTLSSISSAIWANNLSSGAAGEIPWQTAPSSTSFTAPGTAGYLLVSSGTSAAPGWVSQLSVAQNLLSSSSAWTAQQTFNNEIFLSSGISLSSAPINLSGSDGYIYSQSSVTASYFSGNAGGLTNVPGSQVSGAVALASTASYSLNLSSGSPNAIPYQISESSTGFIASPASGQTLLLTWTGSAFTWQPATISTATWANNLIGGAQWQIPYQTGIDQTSFLSSPTISGQALSWYNNQLEWHKPAVDSATWAQSLLNGTTGQIAYQVGVSSTGFLPSGNAGQALLSGGAGGAPSWTDQSALSVGSATAATTLLGASAGAIPYQYGAGSTTFLSGGASVGNYILQMNPGGTAPAWQPVSVVAASLLNTTNTWTAGQIFDQYVTLQGSTLTVTGTDSSGYSLSLSSGIYTPSGTVAANLFSGSGADLTNLPAPNLVGVVPQASLSGSYGQVTGLGVISSGTWQGTILLPKYGGTGTNLSNAAQWSIPYFVANGSMTSAGAPGQDNSILFGYVNGAPVWNSTGTLFGFLLDSTDTWTGGQTFGSEVTLQGSTLTVTGTDSSGYSLSLSSGIYTPSGTVTANVFYGSGAGLTDVSAIDAVNLSSGSIGEIPVQYGVGLSTFMPAMGVGGIIVGQGTSAMPSTATLQGASGQISVSTGAGDVSIALLPSGVAAGSYGDASGASAAIPILTVDAFGRLTSASSATPTGTWPISVTGYAGGLFAGQTGEIPIQYGVGQSTFMPAMGVGGIIVGQGTSAMPSTATLQGASGQISVSTGAGDVSIALLPSGVAAGSYGDASGASAAIPILTVDAFGRLTSASSATPTGTWPISVTGSAATSSSATYLTGTTQSTGINWSADQTFSGTGTGLTVTNSASIGGPSFTVGTSTLAVTGGNVGIGTPSPAASLSVTGNVIVGGNTAAAGSGSSDLTVTGTAFFGTGGAYQVANSGAAKLGTINAGNITVGLIHSSSFTVTQACNNDNGPLPITCANSFTTAGGTVIIIVSGTAYCTAANAMMGIQIEVDGVVKGYTDIYCNNTNHMTLPTNYLVVSGLAAGSHQVTLAYDANYTNTTSDGNDRYSATVLQLPF